MSGNGQGLWVAASKGTRGQAIMGCQGSRCSCGTFREHEGGVQDSVENFRAQEGGPSLWGERRGVGAGPPLGRIFLCLFPLPNCHLSFALSFALSFVLSFLRRAGEQEMGVPLVDP